MSTTACTPDPDVSARDLGAVSVIDSEGRTTTLSEAWSGKTAVLAFIRHFGCPFCRDDVARLTNVQADLGRAGAEVAVVGNGNPLQAKDFLEKSGLRARVYCDEKRESYRIAKMKRGLLRTVGPRSAWYVMGSILRGHMPGSACGWRGSGRGFPSPGWVQGDATQQGGALVITRDGTIAYHHANEVAGEPMRTGEILEAARRVAPAAATAQGA